MSNITCALALLVISAMMMACTAGSGRAPNNTTGGGGGPVDNIVGIATDGKAYYDENCAICHAAGADDSSSAFNASDLGFPDKDALIQTDLSSYGGSGSYLLMRRFANLDSATVANLKSYLVSLGTTN